MSQENVEVVRASFDAWNAGDMGRWAGFLAPDVVWRQPAEWPERGPYVGRESVLRIAVQNRDAWDADTAEPIGDFIDAGDRVVVRFVWRGRGRGPEADMAVTCVNSGWRTSRSASAQRARYSAWSSPEALTGVKLALEADRLLAALRAGRHAQARDLANQISDRAAGIADALAPQPVASPAADVDRSQHANHDQP